MPALDYLLPFLAATAVFAYIPGPGVLYTAAQTMARGRAAGFMAVAGIHLGGYIHVVAATLGLSAILRYVPELYLVVKLAGAAYLVWLGIDIIRHRLDLSTLPHAKAKSTRRSFIESIVVEVLNPKTAIFFIAFLPQFVDSAATLPVWMQFLVLGTIVNFAFSSADVIVVLIAARLLQTVRKSGLGERIARVGGGSLLIGLGVRMALARD